MTELMILITSEMIADSVFDVLEAEEIKRLEFLQASDATPNVRVAIYTVRFIDSDDGATISGAITVVTTPCFFKVTFYAAGQETVLSEGPVVEGRLA